MEVVTCPESLQLGGLRSALSLSSSSGALEVATVVEGMQGGEASSLLTRHWEGAWEVGRVRTGLPGHGGLGSGVGLATCCCPQAVALRCGLSPAAEPQIR